MGGVGIYWRFVDEGGWADAQVWVIGRARTVFKKGLGEIDEPLNLLHFRSLLYADYYAERSAEASAEVSTRMLTK